MGDLSRGAGVRVAICEAEPAASGSLRSILEAEGFDVVGLVGAADDLARLLPLVDVDVLVLDAGTGVMAMVAARGCAPRVAIVTVWPAGVRAEEADQQVEPSRAPAELGAAVIAATRRHHVPSAPPIVGAGLFVVPDLEAQEPMLEPDLVAAAPPPLPEAAKTRALPTRASLALAAAGIFLAFVVAVAAKPGSPPRVAALPPVPTSGPPTGPGSTGPAGDGGHGHPQASKPPRVTPSPSSPAPQVNVAPVSGSSTEGTVGGSGRTVRTSIVRRRDKVRRHRVRHRRRHRRRQHIDHPENGQLGHTHAGGRAHGHTEHPEHPEHGDSSHGNSGHHGNPHD